VGAVNDDLFATFATINNVVIAFLLATVLSMMGFHYNENFFFCVNRDPEDFVRPAPILGSDLRRVEKVGAFFLIRTPSHNSRNKDINQGFQKADTLARNRTILVEYVLSNRCPIRMGAWRK